MRKSLLKITRNGLYCDQGDFYIDPCRSVDKAIITHAHSDHARSGHRNYLACSESRSLLKLRIGENISLETLNYGEQINIDGVKLSFHPAGHILGSSQVRIEYNNEVVVVSGDYKLEPDKTCVAFEPLKCNTFISECTFGLPVYNWCSQQEVFDDINLWWKNNKEDGFTSILFGYTLGKSQRLLSGLDESIGPISVFDNIEQINRCYKDAGIKFPNYMNVRDLNIVQHKGSMIIAPPNLINSGTLRKFGQIRTAFASGWMQVRKQKKSRGFGYGFVLSDHADWEEINKTIDETGADSIWLDHGYTFVLSQWLKEKGKDVKIISSHQKIDLDESPPENLEVTE